MTKIHVLADETLGGIKREYVEVDRKAEVGDLIAYGELIGKFRYNSGIFTHVYYDGAYSGEDVWFTNKCRVLEPTDIVHIDGGRYKMVARRVEVGEKVIVLESEEYPKGFTADVEYFDDFYDDGSFYLTEGIGGNFYIDATSERYRVLVPVELAEADEPQPADPIFAIGNVAQEVAKLKRTIERLENEIDTLHKDNRTLGEELARLKEPKDNEINYEDAALVFIQRERTGPVEIYQDGKRLRGVLSVNINSKVGELTTHTIEFGTGSTAGERP